MPTDSAVQAQLDAIAAELTALNFLLEAAWANIALNHGAAPWEIEALGETLLHQFQSLPPSSSTGPAAANDTDLRDQAAQRVAAFFRRLRDRVGSA